MSYPHTFFGRAVSDSCAGFGFYGGFRADIADLWSWFWGKSWEFLFITIGIKAICIMLMWWVGRWGWWAAVVVVMAAAAGGAHRWPTVRGTHRWSTAGGSHRWPARPSPLASQFVGIRGGWGSCQAHQHLTNTTTHNFKQWKCRVGHCVLFRS